MNLVKESLEDFLSEEAMGGVSAPMSTLNNTPGMGNAQPPSQTSVGSGDKWCDSSLGPYTQKTDENSINPTDKIGIMMAKKMKVPLYFKKGKGQSIRQKNIHKNVNESFRLRGITYDVHIMNNNEPILAGPNGILGYEDVLIPWVEIKKLLKRYSN